MKRVLLLFAVLAMFVACGGAKTPVDEICDLTEELMDVVASGNMEENPDALLKAFKLMSIFEEQKDYVLTDSDKDKLNNLLENIAKTAKASKEVTDSDEEIEASIKEASEALKDAKTLNDIKGAINF